MSLDILSLLRPGFWFDLGPQPPSDAVSLAVFAFFGLLVVAAVVLRLARRRLADKITRVIWRRLSNVLLVAGLTGATLFFLHFERIRFFGARFWMLLWLVGVAVLAARFVRFVRVDVPNRRSRAAQADTRSKYLPNARA